MRGIVVLGAHGGRQFKHVFEEAQKELRDKFGMEMTELPVKEKVTISQRRGMGISPRSCSAIGSEHIPYQLVLKAHFPYSLSRPTHRKPSHKHENVDLDHHSTAQVPQRPCHPLAASCPYLQRRINICRNLHFHPHAPCALPRWIHP